MSKPDPHGSKLKALLVNKKLNSTDMPRIQQAIGKYEQLKSDLDSLDDLETLLEDKVNLINVYKKHIDFELIYNSPNDFLYRQNGQLKLSNSILEEFIPYFIDERLIPGIKHIAELSYGSKSSFSGLSFGGSIQPLNKGGVFLKVKDQDFALAKKHKITIEEVANSENKFTKDFEVAYFAAEIKTNLDKTMFQEASQTANELKIAVTGSKYLLLCEYLDMTPINTKLTAIDEVVILRQAKRLSSNIRKNFDTVKGRQSYADEYEEFLDQNPLSVTSFKRLITHLNEAFPATLEVDQSAVLKRGYF
ncbi:Bpu10I family restriction endonuclease [Acinetobacter johnsonii]|uniref:Bpu10I family restriction endonuclease n=1 Tax=Acinetobacter johnsonii TaxID=40214 RepID=UPI00257730DB|nr:Bpu10I family restriction endonuclease [Acinetobacter johnsonii]MDM1249944.1 Bpu10I family restriction endonuclease [Acinetobacter johnsonii]